MPWLTFMSGNKTRDPDVDEGWAVLGGVACVVINHFTL